jgi:hypothetical protein
MKLSHRLIENYVYNTSDKIYESIKYRELSKPNNKETKN